MWPVENLLLIVAGLLFVSVIASKASDKLGVPALILFLIIGMLSGSEGLLGIHFDNPWLAKSVGSVALAFILFTGGLDTSWQEVKPVFSEGLLLATVGVVLTAVLMGWLATAALGFSWREGLLLGSIVSSTDAAAVFAVLSSRRVGLKGRLKPLLEFESGSNDPMAVFLTLGFISLIREPGRSMLQLIPNFVLDMGIGAVLGAVMPKVMLTLINRLRLEYEGLYPVLTLSLVVLTYALTATLHGNGFLAVYIAGLVLGHNKFLHKKTLKRFHEGLAWLMQIAMFFTLGLQVLPSRLLPILGMGLLAALFLMLVARPASIFACLIPSRFSIREKLMVSWVGLRGAAPIVLATFPLLAGLAKSEMIFNLVFFIVITSVLLQGTTLPAVARWLRVDAPLPKKEIYPLEFEEIEGINANLSDLLVPYNSEAVGKTIFEIGVPKDCLVVLISKGDRFIIPNGSTTLEGGDVLLVLANSHDLAELNAAISRQKRNPEKD